MFGLLCHILQILRHRAARGTPSPVAREAPQERPLAHQIPDAARFAAQEVCDSGFVEDVVGRAFQHLGFGFREFDLRAHGGIVARKWVNVKG